MQLSLPQNSHKRNGVCAYIRQRQERIYFFYFLVKSYYYTPLSTQLSIQTIYIKEKYVFIVNDVDKIHRGKPLDFVPSYFGAK